MFQLPPLSLYIHTPWCQSRCPYCDFNAYATSQPLPEKSYVDALLADLECDLPHVHGRKIESIFIGGGTPSLLKPETIASILEGVWDRLTPVDAVEITIEANPGSTDAAKFTAFRQAGINRLSIGIQSLDDDTLKRIGRSHSARQAREAFAAARSAGFDNVNLDLMFALPGQSYRRGIADIEQLMLMESEHISLYQLTIEPGTPFHANPPELPDEALCWRLETHTSKLLHEAGYNRYEVSAYAREGHRCRHNMNYWEFGDYLGIGSGAHAKLTLADGGILRIEKHRNPRTYMNARHDNRFRARSLHPDKSETAFEFMLNAMRLSDGFGRETFETRTGLEFQFIEARIDALRKRGLLQGKSGTVRTTALGMRFLNEVQIEFFPPESHP